MLITVIEQELGNSNLGDAIKTTVVYNEIKSIGVGLGKGDDKIDITSVA